MADEPKIMLLTGASRGIGHATVKLFQERGWKILTVSRQPFSEECRWPAARWSHVQADLADLDSIEALAATVKSRLPDGKRVRELLGTHTSGTSPPPRPRSTSNDCAPTSLCCSRASTASRWSTWTMRRRRRSPGR